MRKLVILTVGLLLFGVNICSYGQELTPKKRNGKWGVVDKTGNVVIPFEYKEAREFSEGLAAVKWISEYWGFIDKTGNVVIPFEYYWAVRDFKEGLAAVRYQDRWGFIDKTGRVVIHFEYHKANSFSEGLAAVKRGSKWGFIDKTGNVVIPFEYYWTVRDFKEGLAAVQRGNKWGFVDETGKVVVPFEYKEVREFSEGLAAVKRGSEWGYIDKTGNVVIPFEYKYVGDFSEGLAAVWRNYWDYWGFIDKTGKEIIPCKYFEVRDFSEGFAAVTNGDKWGYIDKTGKEVVPIKHLNKFDADLVVKKIKDRVREERERAERERIANLFSTFAKAYVEPRINEWAQKGEFETTAAWQQSVNETTRREQTARFTQEAKERYVAEQVRKRPAIDLSLGRYNADNETFSIINNIDKIMGLQVPLNKAENFKNSWAQITRTGLYVIENDQMALVGIDFKLFNGETYQCRTSNYAEPQTDYNFVAVEIEDARAWSDYDVITLRNGDEIKAKVIEITPSEIKYKRFDNLDGPARVALKTDVFAINYANGSRELFNTITDNTTTAEQDEITLENPYEFRFYIGTGSGSSYGTLGTTYEARFNQFGAHAGIGWFPLLDTPTWSLGAKWYFWKNLYLDAIFGVVGSHLELGYKNLNYYEKHSAILGLTPMIGGNWSWGGKVRFGINVGIGYSYGFKYDLKGIAYDAGINISFGTR